MDDPLSQHQGQLIRTLLSLRLADYTQYVTVLARRAYSVIDWLHRRRLGLGFGGTKNHFATVS